MTRYIALLRAVNVGGTGKLRMPDLIAACRDAGFKKVETYIASGNVVFESRSSPSTVKAELESRVQARLHKKIAVFVRTGEEMRAVLHANPFPEAEPKLTYTIFLDEPPPADTLNKVTGRKDEEMHLGSREIFVHYPSGMGRSKLRIPAAKTGTARNMNTVAKLVEIAVSSRTVS
jgi:uncharacterized protein (DUF1697 family)